jgi:hypothetical protein
VDGPEGTATERYTVRFRVTPDLMLRAMRLHQTIFMQRFRAVLAVAAIVGVAIAIGINVQLGVTIAVFAGLILATTWVQFVDRWLLGNRGRGYVGEMLTYDADDRGLHYDGPLGSGTLAWSGLTAVRADDQTIAFGRDRVLAAYIPTSAFASPVECEAFLEFARARIGKGTA